MKQHINVWVMKSSVDRIREEFPDISVSAAIRLILSKWQKSLPSGREEERGDRG